MGLRTASVRRPNAVVMAPALTESTQAQNFKLPPTSRSASPINNIVEENEYYTNEVTYIKASDINSCVLKGKQFNNVFDNLNTLALASELLKTENCLGTINRASDISQVPTLESSMMSNCSISMEDQTEDKMGIQKAGLDNVSNLLIKDKSVTSDMDQILNNLSSDLPVSDIPVDIGQNVDDIMQVIKSIEGGSERTTSDLGGETDSMFPLTTNDLASNLELFNDVMNISMSMEDDGVASYKETQAKELITDINKRQVKLERRLEFLLRRLRKFQIRDMGQHFSGEVAGVFEHVHRLLKRLKDNSANDSQLQLLDVDQSNSSISEQTNDSMQPLEKMKPISQNSSKSLVRKLEMSTLFQANVSSRQRHAPRYFGSGSLEANNFRTGSAGMLVFPKWTQESKKELEKVSGLLHSEISLVQQELDSEATASSSGGESCDEMQNYNNPTQQSLSM